MYKEFCVGALFCKVSRMFTKFATQNYHLHLHGICIWQYLQKHSKLIGSCWEKTIEKLIVEKIKTFGNLLAKTKWKNEKEFQSNFLLPWFAISNFRQHFHRSESLLLSFLITTKTAKLLDNFRRKLSILKFRKK